MSANKQTKITMLVEAGQAKTAYAEMGASADGFSKAAASSGVAAQASLTQIEAAQRRVAGSSQIESAGLRQVAAAESAMAVGAVEATATTETLAASQNQVAAATRGAGVAQIQGAAANQVGAAAAAENAAAQAALGAESEVSTAKIIKVGVAIDKLAGVGVAGGKQITALAGALSAMSLVQLGAIAGVALLVGWILQRIKAERELISVNEEALKLDLARAATSKGQQDLTKDLTALLLQYQSATKAYTSDQQKETEGYYALAAAQRVEDEMKARGVERTLQATLTAKLFGVTIDDVRHKQEELTKKRQDDEVQLHKTIEALVKFARESGQSSARILEAARAYGVTGQALADLTTKLTGAELAQLRLNSAIEAAKAPQVDFTKTREAILPLQKGVKAGMDEVAASGVKRYDDQIRANHKSLSELSAAVKNHTIVMSDLNAETQTAVRRHEQLTEKHHSAGAGAKAYANALVDLKARQQDAEAALLGDAFAIREERIKTAMDRERQHLEINKRDKTAALEALAAIERAQLTKTSQDRVEAEQRVMVEIARVHIALIRDDTERKRAEMALDIAMRSQAITKEFGDTTQAVDMIAAYRRAKLAEFNQWEADTNAKHWLEQRRTREDEERQLYDKLRQERQKFLVEQRQQRQEMERRHFESFGGQFSDRKAAVGRGIDINRVKQLEEATRRLGLSQVQFDHALQVTNRDLASFERLMQRTQQFTRGNWFAGLIGSIRDVGKAFVEGGLLGQAWSDAIVGAFEITLQSGGNFAATFGKLLLGGILSAFGQMAIAQGTFHILSGISLMANPWTFAQGAREFAGGTALVAFGALLGAAGSMISASARSGSRGGGAASQSSAQGAPTTTSPPSSSTRASGPVLINVPTSAARGPWDSLIERLAESRRDLAAQRANREAISQRNSMQMDSGPITIAVTLGTEAGEKFLSGILDGRGVLTINNALGQHRARLMKGLKKG